MFRVEIDTYDYKGPITYIPIVTEYENRAYSVFGKFRDYLKVEAVIRLYGPGRKVIDTHRTRSAEDGFTPRLDDTRSVC